MNFLILKYPEARKYPTSASKKCTFLCSNIPSHYFFSWLKFESIVVDVLLEKSIVKTAVETGASPDVFAEKYA